MRASKMTIITGLKYNEVETTESLGSVNVRSFSLGWLNEYPNIALTKDAEPPLQVTYTDYCIRGRRIRTPNGKEVYLGNSPVVEEFLGLQFDLFENMKKEKSDALFRLSNAEKEKSDALFKLSESQQAVEQLRGHELPQKVEILIHRRTGMRVFLRALMSLICKPSKADKIQGILNSGAIPVCYLTTFLDGLVQRTILRVQGKSGNAAWENWAIRWLSGEDKTAKAVSVLLSEADRSQGYTWVAAWSACGVWTDSWIASNACLNSWMPDDDIAAIEYVNRAISSSLRLLRDVTPVGFEVAYQTEVDIQYNDLLKLIKEMSDENCYKDNQGHVLRCAA